MRAALSEGGESFCKKCYDNNEKKLQFHLSEEAYMIYNRKT